MQVIVVFLLCGLLATPAFSIEQPAATAASGVLQAIGVNDLLSVFVYGCPELTRSVRVGEDGTIRLPMLRQTIPARGLVVGEIEAAVRRALQEEQIVVNPYVTVDVAEFGSRSISVVGAVRTPGTFQAAGPVTLLEAIARAGGLSASAGPDILVTDTPDGSSADGSAPARRIAVKTLIDEAAPEANVVLSGGEQIRVPEVRKIFVVGNVRKPGQFPVANDSSTTVLRALAMSEGLAPFAAKKCYIIRTQDGSGKREEIPVELGRILARKADDVALVADDILYVPDSTNRRRTIALLERLTSFGAATASGVIIWGSR